MCTAMPAHAVCTHINSIANVERKRSGTSGPSWGSVLGSVMGSTA